MPPRSERAPERIEAIAEVRRRALRVGDVAGEKYIAVEIGYEARGLGDLGLSAHADVAGAQHRDGQSGWAATASANTAAADRRT
jgi:hypothetical protein